MLNATYQSGAYTRKIGTFKSQTIVEIKFTGQDIGEATAVYPQVSLNSAEVSSGRINYSGRLICTLVYSDGENLCRMQKGAEFSHFCDNEAFTPSEQCGCVLTCERTTIRREGSSFAVAVVVGAEISVYDGAMRSYLSALDGAVTDGGTQKLLTCVHFSGESELEDSFDCVASDVLVPSAELLVLSCEVKTDYIEVTGELYLSLLAVRDASPVGLDRVIPYKAEITCEQAILPRPASCRAEIKELNVECKVNEESGKCEVTIDSTLAFTGSFYEEEEIPLVIDAFSLTNNLSLNYAEEKNEVPTGIKIFSERVSGLCAVKAKLDYTCAFLATALPKAEFSPSEDGIGGSVNATLLYMQNGEIRSSQISLPFFISLTGCDLTCAEITAAVCGISVRQRAEGECEAEAALKICVTERETRCVKYLCEVSEGEPIERRLSAISVYIPKAGDGLWETAKKACGAPDDIIKSNPDLKFPLTGKERILIFRPAVG